MAASASVITVSQDGKGHYRTVQEAIDAVPLGNTRRTVIRVSPGIYKQPLYVAKTKRFITLVGTCLEDTVLTWNNTATKIQHHQVGANLSFFFLVFSSCLGKRVCVKYRNLFHGVLWG